MTGRWTLLALPAGLLVPGALAVSSVRLADSVGFEVGRQLSSVIGPERAAPAVQYAESWFEEPTEATETKSETTTEPEAGAARTARSRRAASARRSTARSDSVTGLSVGAETVLRLANAGVRPGGVPVPATAERPGGVALLGVSGLGLGARDGDVITSVEGSPARSVGSVVGAVLVARSRGAAHVTAQAWRGDTPYSIRVEMPYPEAPDERPGRVAAVRPSSNAN